MLTNNFAVLKRNLKEDRASVDLLMSHCTNPDKRQAYSGVYQKLSEAIAILESLNNAS